MIEYRLTKASLMLLSSLLVTSEARGQCVEDPRQVQFGSGEVVRIKKYACGDVNVEFHRFSDTVPALWVSDASSNILREVIGEPKIIRNPVYFVLEELIEQFGE